MPNINQLVATASNAGFQAYSSVPDTDNCADEVRIQHDILTCLSGVHSGEVIDIYYDYDNGFVRHVEYSTQFKGQNPLFRFN